jgi:hypothetical protein
VTRLVPALGVGGWWWWPVEGGAVSHLGDKGDVVGGPEQFHGLSVHIPVMKPAHQNQVL